MQTQQITKIVNQGSHEAFSGSQFQIEDLCERLHHVLEDGQLPSVLYREFARPPVLVKIPEERPETRKPNELEAVDLFTQVISPNRIQIRVQRKKASKNVLDDYEEPDQTIEYLINSPVANRKLVKKVASGSVEGNIFFPPSRKITSNSGLPDL
jgi:hypothetical protein